MHEFPLEPELELKLINKYDGWSTVFQHVCAEAQHRFELSFSDARRPEFKSRNRYQDVSPFDHSRIRLERNHIDYINASRVEVPRAKRAYILTQTVSHFWVMVWERKCPAVLMLNRFVEKDHPKCHPYLPERASLGLFLEDVGLEISHVEDRKSSEHFVTRLLRIRDVETDERHDLLHFHYLPWPDFGEPPSPDSFLDFLFHVRGSGALDRPDRPAVVHCSAGVGRSGVFCLVEACLRIAEVNGSSSNLDVRGLLVEMRRYRMGLIQTPNQLRFSYVALVEGLKRLNLNREQKHLSPEEENRFLEVNFNNASPTAEGLGSQDDDEDDDDRNDNSLSCRAPTLRRGSERKGSSSGGGGGKKRCSLGRFAPHPGSVEDPESVWLLNNSTVSGEPVVIMPGISATSEEEDGYYGDREGSGIEEDEDEDDDDDGEDDEEERKTTTTRRRRRRMSSDVDGKERSEEEEAEEEEETGHRPGQIVRRPLSERSKKSWLEMEEMARRQRDACPELERRRRRRTRIKLIAWSATVVLVGVVIYRSLC